MASETLELFLTLLPKIPLMVRVSILHVLQISEQSNYLDLRSELTVAVIRSLLSPSVPRTITDTQKLVNRDPGIKGRIWISKVASPTPPETSVREVLLETIRSLRHAKTKGVSVRSPEMVPVEAEWTGYRDGVSSDAKLPEMSEAERYRSMMKEVRKPTTVLYLHGGAYYLMDPATHRPTTKKIAKLTGGRCYSVRYRLSPQHAFPAALLDALCAYLTLLYPPPGSLHQAVKPEHIVFSGDR
jgi:acetyl esterase/lipase